MPRSRRLVTWLLAAIMLAVGSVSAQIVCARMSAAAHEHCPGCADHDDDSDAPGDLACAARVAAFYHAIIATVLPFMPPTGRQLPAIETAEKPAMRAEAPDPPPPRIRARV